MWPSEDRARIFTWYRSHTPETIVHVNDQALETHNEKTLGARIHLFERAIPVKQLTGGWLTGNALAGSDGGRSIPFDTKEKYTLAMDAAASFGFGSTARIYLPGIGFSDAATFLKTKYPNVVAGDVSEAHESLSYQKKQGIQPLVSNILTDTIHPPCDVLIDSSVLDVFLARSGLPIAQAVTGMKRQMTPDGVFICFSMNNRTMHRQLTGKFAHIWYAFLKMEAPQSLKRRTNNLIKRADVSLWLCCSGHRDDAQIRRISSLLPSRPYLSHFLYNPTANQISNQELSLEKFYNISNPSV